MKVELGGTGESGEVGEEGGRAVGERRPVEMDEVETRWRCRSREAWSRRALRLEGAVLGAMHR